MKLARVSCGLFDHCFFGMVQCTIILFIPVIGYVRSVRALVEAGPQIRKRKVCLTQNPTIR